MEVECRIMAARDYRCAGRNGELLAKGLTVSVRQDEWVRKANVEQCEYIEQYCIICLKCAKRVDLKCSPQPK